MTNNRDNKRKIETKRLFYLVPVIIAGDFFGMSVIVLSRGYIRIFDFINFFITLFIGIGVLIFIAWTIKKKEKE